MYNLRYHIASLVAVFLALAVGLVLGGIVVERGTLDAQRNALVTGLRNDFARLNVENRTLKQRLDADTRFSRAIADGASAGRLAGKRIVIVANSDGGDAVQAASRAIEQAGGIVAVVQVRKPGFGQVVDTGTKQLGSQAGSTAPGVDGSVAASLAAEWLDGATVRPVTDSLVQSGSARLQGLDAGQQADGVVIAATADGRPDVVTLQVGESFIRSARAAVGVESLTGNTGIAAASANLGLGAVSGIDTPAGAWSLVQMLSGGDPAFYGQAPEASAPFAPLPQPEAPSR